MFRTFGVIGCALWNGALDAVKGIVVVVQGLQGYDVQLNNEERVRVGSRTCSEMVPSYGSHESAST